MNVLINGISWKIVFTNNFDELTKMDGTVTLGITDLDKRTIFLFSLLKGRMLRKVLIHELTHAFMFSYDFYLSIEEEEFICSFLSSYGDEIINDADCLINQCINIMCS